ncbi:MAG: topoisomerase DNA-binding C4 zinc finger domain-containing protein [Patescibacteria group bacterium]
MQESKGPGATAVKERLCPKCEKPMVQRKSKYGPFLGCSGYPKCKQIEKN